MGLINKQNLTKKLPRRLQKTLGFDIGKEDYTYGTDERIGYVSESKIPQRWVKSTCGYCSVGCGMLLGVKDDRVVSVRGDGDHPVNAGSLCPKGLSEHYSLQAPNRAKTPLLHGRAVSWDRALDHMVSTVGQVQAQHGPDSFAVLSTGQLVTEEFYTLGKLVQLGFGTRNYDGNTTLCMSSAVAGYKQSFGSDGPPGSYAGLREADVVFLIGANIADNHPILWHHLNQNPGRTLIVCDPRKTKTAMFADLFLPIKPRGDIDLLNGLIHLAVAKGAVDRRFVDEHTAGYEALAAHARRFPPAAAAARAGIDEALLHRCFDTLAGAKNAYFAWTMGVNQSTQGSDTVSLINTLALLMGHIGRTGAAPMSITGQCNAMGTREFGFSSSMPGYRRFEDTGQRAELARLWNVDPKRIPTQRGLAYPDIIDAVLDGQVKALWVIGTNPVASFPDQERLKKALRRLDLLIVQDGYHPTPTTELAHLVLPAAIWGEKDGTFTNSERRVGRVRQAVSPPGQARSDFDIFLDLAGRLDCRDELFPDWHSPADAFAEMGRISKGRLCDYSGLSYAMLEEKGGVQWPCNEAAPDGTDSLYADGVFPTPDGRARLLFTDAEALPEAPDADYPLLLNTGRTVEHWHTRTKTGAIPVLQHLAPEPWVEMHPDTAADYGVTPRHRVTLESRRGRVDGLLVRLTRTLRPGHIFVPFHFAEQCVNQLTLPAFCPKSRQPNYKQCAVRLGKSRT